jgi:hypothetical protein
LRYLSNSEISQAEGQQNGGNSQDNNASGIKNTLQENMDGLKKILNNGCDLITHHFGSGRTTPFGRFNVF